MAAHETRLAAYATAIDAWAALGADEAAKPISPSEPEYVSVDILVFWRANKHKVPIIAQFARRLLVIAISSAEVERLFSRGGLVLTSRRNRLGAEKEAY